RSVMMFDLLQTIFDKTFKFDSTDDARSFFLDLQNDLKNVNYLVFESSEFKELLKRIENKLNI
ncbi:MAG: hypothetical protein K1000chlam1_01214, partial [Candidatus Anoxychlamydiales bacterium]|nr:hypothetical protein [Candidatus Anoxychlamydiales bacterium]